MRCEEVESRLNELLDERRNPLEDPAIVAHCGDCSHCAALARGYDAIAEGVAAWERVEPSADLTNRVIEQWEMVRAQSAQTSTVDWDSAELPALRPVGLQRTDPSTLAGGVWSQRRNYALAGAALATAAMLLVLSNVGNWGAVDQAGKSDESPAIADALANTPVEQKVAQNTPKNAGAAPAASQLSFANIPLVEQVTETYRPLLEETDRTFRKSLGIPAYSSGEQSLASNPETGLTDQADSDASGSSWDAYLPEQMAPVTQTAVRSVVALLRVLPGVEQPLQ